MSLVKVVRQGAVTPPAESRMALRIKEGDYLEAGVVEGEIRLRPVAMIDHKAAWQTIRAAQGSVRWFGPGPRPDPEEEERQTYAIVEESHDRDA